jgi:S-adenosylhomocysteine hydrolase
MSSAITQQALFPAVYESIYEFTVEAAEMFGDLKGIEIVFVGHAFDNVIPLAQAIGAVGDLRSVVLKDSTQALHPEVADRMRAAGIPVSELTKADFASGNQAAIEEFMTGDAPLIVMDHGGYFAYGDNLARLSEREGGLIGVVEYTLNGEERYHRVAGAPVPVLSVATSRVKSAGDIAVAEAIVLESEHFLSRCGIGLLDKRTGIGIVGQGRLGSAIGETLIRRGARRVWVDEVDPVRRASQRTFELADTLALIAHCDVVFLATGNRSITEEHLAVARDDTVILTVTSPDDELDLDGLVASGALQPLGSTRPDVSSYVVAATGRRIHLPFHGQAANMMSPYGNSDPTIHLPNAAHLATAVVLGRHAQDFTPGVSPLPREVENVVAQVFDAAFTEVSTIH